MFPRGPTEGLHALAADARGNSVRRLARSSAAARNQALRGALRPTAALTWSKNVLIYQSPDGTICECCHPSVAIDKSGRILVMWRNSLGGSRDMYQCVLRRR